jgi:hypothetical protein
VLGFNPPKEEGGGDNLALPEKRFEINFVARRSDYNSNSSEFSVAAQELHFVVRKKQLIPQFKSG